MKSIEHINYIKAPTDQVYEALTSQPGLGEVWASKLTVKPEVGFVNVFDFGEGYLTRMQVVELAPNHYILWNCVDSDEEWLGTKVSFELSEEENTTRILLRHFDWREVTDYFRWCNYNWALFLNRLKTYCEKQ